VLSRRDHRPFAVLAFAAALIASQLRGTATAGCVYSAVSAGGQHACGLRLDGTVQCWGENRDGQSLPPPEAFRSISTGFLHTCGLRADGTAHCWGDNSEGQSVSSGEPYLAVTAGGYHTCGLKTDGHVECWGNNQLQQLAEPEGTFKSIAAGGSHTCGMRMDGTLACWGDSVVYNHPPPSGTFTSISVGAHYNCAQRSDGTLRCWTHDTSGLETPPPEEPVVAYAASTYGACAVLESGALTCWGRIPELFVPPSGTFQQISGGDLHYCGLRLNGVVQCWGYNRAGQASPPGRPFIAQSGFCGLRSDRSIACWGSIVVEPVSHAGPYADVSGAVAPPGSVVALSANTYGACGLRSDGTAQCWGLNAERFDAGDETFTRISAGDTNSCGIRQDGTLYCWAYEEFLEWTPPEGSFIEVSTGRNGQHACGIRPDRTVECWGPTDYPDPPPPGTFQQVSAAGWTSCALRDDGIVECWGDDYWGQASPPPGTFLSVSAGGAQSPWHSWGTSLESCGLRENGTIECWGEPSGIQPPCRASLRCGQPRSGDETSYPLASDALLILRAAVGAITDCNGDPCMCDVNSSGSVSSVDALATLRAAVEQESLGCACAHL
jgi:alpha-tubulin suppressor-like RCC1 family protein